MYYTLYAHTKKILVSKGQVLNGKHAVALNGTTGNSSGDHLHFQVCESVSHNPIINSFDGRHSPYSWPIDPLFVMQKYATKSSGGSASNKYDEPSPNDITLGFNYNKSPYSASWPHQGIDFSGVEDKPYEEDEVYSLGNANSTVVETGWHEEFGNYVILRINGPKQNTGKEKDIMWLASNSKTPETIEVIESGIIASHVEFIDGVPTGDYIQYGDSKTKKGEHFETFMIRTKEGAHEADTRVRRILSGPYEGKYIFSRYKGKNKVRVI